MKKFSVEEVKGFFKIYMETISNEKMITIDGDDLQDLSMGLAKVFAKQIKKFSFEDVLDLYMWEVFVVFLNENYKDKDKDIYIKKIESIKNKEKRYELLEWFEDYLNDWRD